MLSYTEMQVPWRALRSRPVVIELADVQVCAAPREEADWEEGPARRRALAAKQAQLAAAELERLAKAGPQVTSCCRTARSCRASLGPAPCKCQALSLPLHAVKPHACHYLYGKQFDVCKASASLLAATSHRASLQNHYDNVYTCLGMCAFLSFASDCDFFIIQHHCLCACMC